LKQEKNCGRSHANDWLRRGPHSYALHSQQASQRVKKSPHCTPSWSNMHTKNLFNSVGHVLVRQLESPVMVTAKCVLVLTPESQPVGRWQLWRGKAYSSEVGRMRDTDMSPAHGEADASRVNRSAVRAQNRAIIDPRARCCVVIVGSRV